MKQVIAYPGYALVGMKPRYGDFVGQLAIPGTARSRKTIGRLGVVCSVNPYPENKDSLIFEKGKLVPRPAWRMNDWYTALTGEWVLVQNAALVFGQLYSVRLEFIESVACEEVEPQEAMVGRCLQCKSKGEANILLGGDGFCPVCGLNMFGEHVDARDLAGMFANDREMHDNMVRIPAELQHMMDGGSALKGKIFSYAGQKNHTAPKKGHISGEMKRKLES